MPRLKNFIIGFVFLLSLSLCMSCIHDIEEEIVAKMPTLNITIKTKEILLEKSDIILEFNEGDFVGDFVCSENLPIKLIEGEKKEVSITTIATENYLSFQKKVIIECNSHTPLNLKKISIFGKVASSKFYIPNDKNKIEKVDIALEFIQNDVSAFDIMPNPFKIEDGEDEKKLIIFIDESPLYERWQMEIDVLREKTENKTIDDAVLKLESLISCANTTDFRIRQLNGCLLIFCIAQMMEQ